MNTNFYYQPNNSELSQLIDSGNRCIISELNGLNSRISSALKPSAPKVTGYSIVNESGTLCFARHYDNGTSRLFPLLTITTGAYSLYKLTFIEFDETPVLFAIEFGDMNVCIIGEMKRLKGSYIYELFIEHGFTFNDAVAKNKLPNALHSFFTPKIKNTKSVSELPALAGFGTGFRFLDCNAVPDLEILKSLPISQKSFERLPIKRDTFDLYTQQILRFKIPKDRFLVAVYPFACMMSSLFESEGCNFDFALNFVPTEGIDPKKICEIFQIFNRDILASINSEMTTKALDGYLRTVKDEAIIMDFRSMNDRNYSREKARMNNLHRVLAVISGQKTLPNQKRSRVCAGLVGISDNIILQPNVHNILLNDEMVKNNDTHEYNIDFFMEGKVMERILSQFITFIENLGDKIFPIFMKKRDVKTETGRVLAITVALLSEFWNQYDMDFHKALYFPENIDFDGFYTFNDDVQDAEIELFLDFLRDAVFDYYIVPKDSIYAGEETIFYNNIHLWFPAELFREMCKNGGLSNLRKILLKLRSQGKLVTDADSLSRRIQVNHKTFEAYQFTRQTFSEIGEIDIIDYGKEIVE